MSDPQRQLRNFVKRHDYFIAVDSDGCALDSMELEHNPTPDLLRGFQWSQAANQRIDEVVRGAPAFPLVRESLAKVSEWADVIVCSVAPRAALEREWGAQDLSQYVSPIAAQEFGSKQEIIGLATAGRYERGKTLMLGDAPADNAAARANDALFYPINPGREEESWKRFFEESADRFLNGGYSASYEGKLVEEFEALLPLEAPWKVGTT